ncbi:MAG: hypothetical protein VCA36_04950 [Opitutales bacterium]
MKRKTFSHVVSIGLLLALPVIAQEEAPGELEAELREHFTEIGFELRENLDEMLESKGQLEQEQGEARQSEEEEDLAHLALEMSRLEDGINAWRDLLARHEKMMALQGEAFLEEEGKFNLALENAHRQRQLAETKADVEHLETRLRFLDAEEDDQRSRVGLERELQMAREELASRRELMAGWEKVDAARAEDRHEEADELERSLWLSERELDIKREAGEIESRAIEASERAADLRKEVAATEMEAKMAKHILKHHVQLAQRWKRTRAALNDANEEQREELLEQFERFEEKHYLNREIMETRLHLARANAYGDEDEADELNQRLKGLEKETRELEEF